MKVLLDTHALLWAYIAPSSLSKEATKIITSDASILMVSVASVWEIATKVRNGKLPEAANPERGLLETLNEDGYALISIDAENALRAARLAGDHRDPFDRMIAAQAIALDIPVISKDPRLDSFGVRRIW